MKAGEEYPRRDAPRMIYLGAQGRYLNKQARPDPPDAGDETTTLLGFLERQRATFAWKCGGLDAAGLRATAGASPMTLGGMLKHLTRFEDDMAAECGCTGDGSGPRGTESTGTLTPTGTGARPPTIPRSSCMHAGRRP